MLLLYGIKQHHGQISNIKVPIYPRASITLTRRNRIPRDFLGTYLEEHHGDTPSEFDKIGLGLVLLSRPMFTVAVTPDKETPLFAIATLIIKLIIRHPRNNTYI